MTRLSWALNFKSRTLRAEIDLPNPGSQILPGMYAYGKVIVERPNVRALPRSALTYVGGKSFYWRYENGHALRTEVQTGDTDGEWTAPRTPVPRSDPRFGRAAHPARDSARSRWTAPRTPVPRSDPVGRDAPRRDWHVRTGTRQAPAALSRPVARTPEIDPNAASV